MHFDETSTHRSGNVDGVDAASQVHSRPYRRDIDGLRALAVVFVVLYHAFPESFRGGFIGVDVFFVISGFLISGIVFSELENRQFSLTRFYIRRIRRIFPALLVVLITFWLISWVVLFSPEYKHLGKHMVAGAGFLSNFALWQESGYFDNAAESKLLLHLWSLGIEEQFYIFWPVAAYLAWREKHLFLAGMLLATAASFLLNLHEIHEVNLAAAFFSPLTRIWELLCGSLLAWAYLHPSTSKGWMRALEGRPWPHVFSITGLLLLLYGFASIDNAVGFPGAWALIPVGGALLMIMAGPGGVINRTLLSNPVVVWFGLISFPLYLWHWPVFSLARTMERAPLSWPVMLLAIVLSVVLAWATYEVVEKPVRQRAASPRVALVLLVLMGLTGVLGLATYLSNGFPNRMPAAEKIFSGIGKWSFPAGLQYVPFKDGNYWQTGASGKNATLFLGDSTMSQYAPRIEELHRLRGGEVNDAIFYTRHGCLAIQGALYEGVLDCRGYIGDAIELALSNDRINTVVLINQWYGAMDATGAWYLMEEGEKLWIRPDHKGYEVALSRLSENLSRLVAANKRVTIVLPTPFGDKLDPAGLIPRRLSDPGSLPYFGDTVISQGVMLSEFAEVHSKIRDDIVRIATAAGASIVDPAAHLCKDGICPSMTAAGMPLYMDRSHLNADFVRSQVQYLDHTIETQR